MASAFNACLMLYQRSTSAPMGEARESSDESLLRLSGSSASARS